MIASMEGLHRVYGRLEKHPESPLLWRERPWEQGLLHPMYVLFDPQLGLFHMWYWSRPAPGEAGRVSLCYASSEDGIHWTRPDLDLVTLSPEEGGTPNNILDSGPPVHPAFIDPDAVDASQRIVLLRGRSVWTSPDGIHLEKRGEFPDMRHAPETEPSPRSKYFFTTQTWAGSREWGAPRRGAMRVESDDLLHWRGRRTIFEVGPDDPQDLEYYGMSSPGIRTSETYHGWHFGFLEAFHTDPDGKRHPSNHVAMSGTIDIVLTASRDTAHWFRVQGHHPFLSLGPAGSFDSQMVFLYSMCEVGDRLYSCYNGWDVGHGIFLGTPTVAGHAWIGLATLRLDGFVALAPEHGSGSLITRPFVWAGDGIEVNVDASHGELRVELLEEGGVAVPGAGEAGCLPVTTDGPRAAVRWAASPDLAQLAGETVRVRFVLEDDVKLYAFRVVGD